MLFSGGERNAKKSIIPAGDVDHISIAFSWFMFVADLTLVYGRYNELDNYTGWWYTYPSEKYETQLGLLFPIYGKIKNAPNHPQISI